MGSVRQNPIQRTVSLFICVCITLCTIVAHNIAQNRPDSFPLYPPDNHHSSDDVYLREGGEKSHKHTQPKWLELVSNHCLVSWNWITKFPPNNLTRNKNESIQFNCICHQNKHSTSTEYFYITVLRHHTPLKQNKIINLIMLHTNTSLIILRD